MTLHKLKLYEGPSGPELKGQADGDLLKWSEADQAWTAAPETAPARGALRADVCVSVSQSSITFSPGAPGSIRDVIGEAGAFTDVAQGDRLFVQPVSALVGAFHSGDAAPELGGLWLVLSKVDDQNLTLQRTEDLSTSAQVDQTALIAVDGGTGAGCYQVTTPPGSVIDVDPQVMPWATVPPIIDNNTYALQETGGLLSWELVP